MHSPSQNAKEVVPPPPRRGLSRVEAAIYVGLSPSGFDKFVMDGRMPKPKKFDRRRIWDVRKLDIAFDDFSGDELEDENEWNEVYE